MPIKLLSQDTINKIAAGEVVERPLNAVKELVENSLDACASLITIEIKEAGKKLIRISDDGFGMDKSDLEISILRHSTSKINDFNDLSHIQSLGFRGEALSSIAAVSNFEIKTKKKGASEGWKLTTQGGKDIKVLPCSNSYGTTIEVKDLFFNTPARKKFLKTDATEKTKIISAMEELTLANPEISFKLISDGKTILNTAKTNNKLERISDILGNDFAKILKHLDIDHPKAYFDLYFTGRDDSQNNRKNQFFFVNTRPVNIPKWLAHCIYQAYKESIPHDKHPGFLCYLTIEPSNMDVNIHPTKREVKFSDEGSLYDIIYKALKSALTTYAHPQITISNETKEIKNNFPMQRQTQIVEEPKPNYSFNKISKQKFSIDQYATVYAKQSEFTKEFDVNVNILGMAFNTYIIVEKDSELFIFDQHAAAERVRYENYLNHAKDKKLKLQTMLLPESFELSSSLSELLKNNIPILNELGIRVEEFGKNTFRITSYPALLGNISIEQIVKKILDDLEIEKNLEIEKKRDKIIRSACRASIKAGDNVSSIEAKKLINDLFKCKHPFTCPHGRPTAYKITLNDLEKYFKRK